MNLGNKKELKKKKMDFEHCVFRSIHPETGVQLSEPTIDAESLHTYLGIEEPFRAWIKDAIQYGNYKKYDDFDRTFVKDASGREKIDGYAITIQMAREVTLFSDSPCRKKVLKHLNDLLRDEYQRGVTEENLAILRSLVNPESRETFFSGVSYRSDIRGFDPRSFVDELEAEGELTPAQARDQRIINELIFTPKVMDYINGIWGEEEAELPIGKIAYQDEELHEDYLDDEVNRIPHEEFLRLYCSESEEELRIKQLALNVLREHLDIDWDDKDQLRKALMEHVKRLKNVEGFIKANTVRPEDIFPTLVRH